MSLQIWLPLNGNLNNQGLSNVTVTNNGATIDNSGKIGKCYSFNESNRIVCSNVDYSNMINHFSCAFWFNLTKTPSGNDQIINFGPRAGWAVIYFGILINSSRGVYFNIGDGSQYCPTILTTINLNEWNHYCATFDGITLTGYLNGLKIGTITPGYLPGFSSSTQCGIGAAPNGDEAINGKINDVRIYDHCLSPKEVKEISKGLVLHYRLAGPGKANIYKDMSKFALIGSDYPSKSTRTLGKIIITETGSFNAYAWAESYMNPSSADIINSTKTYTISADIKTTGLTSSMIAKFSFDFRRADHSQLVRGTVILNPKYNGQWHRYSATLIGTAQSQTKNLVQFFGSNCNGLTIEYKNFKLEEGSVVTPWIPNSTDISYSALGLNSTTEFDCSGYSNNGTKSGAITCDSDTPRYMTSYKFESTSTKIKLPVIAYSNFGNSYTFSWWEKNTSSGNMPWGFSDGNRLNLYHSSALCWNTGDGSSNPFKDSSGNSISTSRLCDSQWHHCAIVGNGASSILYIDGISVGTATTYKPLTGTQIYISGWDSGGSYTFNGSNLVDFRIYSTALPAKDIKELYNSPISITNNGILMTQGEVIE